MGSFAISAIVVDGASAVIGGIAVLIAKSKGLLSGPEHEVGKSQLSASVAGLKFAAKSTASPLWMTTVTIPQKSAPLWPLPSPTRIRTSASCSNPTATRGPCT